MLQCRKHPGLFQMTVMTIALKRLWQLMYYDVFSLVSHHTKHRQVQLKLQAAKLAICHSGPLKSQGVDGDVIKGFRLPSLCLWRQPYLLPGCKDGNDTENRLSSEAKHSSDGSLPYSLIGRDFLVLFSAKAVLQAGKRLVICPQKS